MSQVHPLWHRRGKGNTVKRDIYCIYTSLAGSSVATEAGAVTGKWLQGEPRVGPSVQEMRAILANTCQETQIFKALGPCGAAEGAGAMGNVKRTDPRS